MQQAELAALRETDPRRQAQMVETLRVIRDMRREMSDMQAELLALREQQRRARQPGPEARIPDHQDASGDANSHIHKNVAEGTKKIVEVDYSWIPCVCSHRKVFGHTDSCCNKKRKVVNEDNSVRNNGNEFKVMHNRKVRRDGFNMNKGNNVQNGQRKEDKEKGIDENANEQVSKEDRQEKGFDIGANTGKAKDINNAITNQIPSQVDSSVRSYMSNHLQQADLLIWLALKIKFEGLIANNTSCRSSVIRLRDQDDHHDDAHPEGENSAKRQKISEHRTYVFRESSSGQANESEPGPSTSGNQEQLDDFDFWTDKYATDDDELPAKKVSQELVEEMSETADEAKLRKVVDEMLRQ
ncbi:hypothetical protein Tco_1236885 [Tanacetum coccineum]